MSQDRLGQVHVPSSRRYEIQLTWQEDDDVGLARAIVQALHRGGCAAVVCNAVGRAQRLYRSLKVHCRSGEEVDLFHARYPYIERERRERRCLERFGKESPGRRPTRAILVATQVIEQSLDLDFDLMVTELAPVDLVLQRAGRLHRHERPQRPIAEPALWILRPTIDSNGVPNFGSSEYVYDRFILLKSYWALRRCGNVSVPDNVEELIEQVYSTELPPNLESAWKDSLRYSLNQLEEQQRESRRIAGQFLIKPPTWEDDILEDFCQQLEEDNPEVHHSLQAMTRLSDPTVQVVCLHEINGRIFLNPDGTGPADLEQEPSAEQLSDLLRRSVTISHPAFVRLLAGQDSPRAWKKKALLRHHRVVVLGPDGEAEVGDLTFRLDTDLGVMIYRTDSPEGAET